MEEADLFDLNDPALEVELRPLSSPIADSAGDLRRPQRESDMVLHPPRKQLARGRSKSRVRKMFRLLLRETPQTLML